MEAAPPYLVQKAVKHEMLDAWNDAFIEIRTQAVPKEANIISCHVTFEIRTEENDRKRLRPRLCPHVNRDQEKGMIRSDLASVQFYIFRLLLSLATDSKFNMGCVGSKAMYLQSGPMLRDLNIRPRREHNHMRGTVWKLKRLRDGFCKAGRRWAKALEHGKLSTLASEESTVSPSRILIMILPLT